MTIEQELQKRQVFEIYPGDRVYLSHLYYPIQLLKKNLERKKEAKIVSNYESADIVIIDELFLDEVMTSKHMHDPRFVEVFEDRPGPAPSKLKLKEAISYILSREDTKYILLKNVYPMFLKTMDESGVLASKSSSYQGEKLLTMFLAGYDPYSVFDFGHHFNLGTFNYSMCKMNKIYRQLHGKNPKHFDTKSKIVDKIIVTTDKDYFNRFGSISEFFSYKEDEIIKNEICRISQKHSLTEQLWKGYLKEIISQ